MASGSRRTGEIGLRYVLFLHVSCSHTNGRRGVAVPPATRVCPHVLSAVHGATLTGRHMRRHPAYPYTPGVVDEEPVQQASSAAQIIRCGSPLLALRPWRNPWARAFHRPSLARHSRRCPLPALPVSPTGPYCAPLAFRRVAHDACAAASIGAHAAGSTTYSTRPTRPIARVSSILCNAPMTLPASFCSSQVLLKAAGTATRSSSPS